MTGEGIIGRMFIGTAPQLPRRIAANVLEAILLFDSGNIYCFEANIMMKGRLSDYNAPLLCGLYILRAVNIGKK